MSLKSTSRAVARRLLMVLGNQLFPLAHVRALAPDLVFMAEDLGLCTYVRHHQQKIVLFLAAMRSYRDALCAAGFEVAYHELDFADARDYVKRLAEVCRAHACEELVHFEIEDKAVEARVVNYSKAVGLRRDEVPSPMFLCSREAFFRFARGRERLRLTDFYKQERQRLGLLLDRDGRPEGARLSYDEDNRRKLPRGVEPPPIAPVPAMPHVDTVKVLVKERFAGHPGDADDFWWPTTRDQSLKWLEDFIDRRLECFGPYEDAMSTRSATVFHSVLSPLMNIGLITPDEIVGGVHAVYRRQASSLPIASVEGFIRQVIGWREFVRGVYREHSDRLERGNFFNHRRGLTEAWYEGSTGIEPLDDTIRTAWSLGWTHHIPRLMVAANLMTLAEVHPEVAHRWFMEMYVDSSEWVMGPNVYGMGLFSAGALFATKPYICGSNYIRKMSDYPKGDWCDIVDGLYWRFIGKHREFFAGNPRLALMPRALDKQSPDRLARIVAAAERFLDTQTRELRQY